MDQDRGQVMIRKAAEEDARQIAEIIVEDWKTAYRGIIDSAYLDSMSVEQRYQREAQRYRQYMVASDENEVLGFIWNEMTGVEAADCEIVALYVRYTKRRSGIGRALFRYSVDTFRASGKKRMIVWCLKENDEARKFYEKMGGKAYKTYNGPHVKTMHEEIIVNSEEVT
ncbi:MAG: GNAT family N-acetyltransferase [Clostridia bacterium]|nr:GNAT family N-acetyltransferase [Clostridia bacterium]